MNVVNEKTRQVVTNENIVHFDLDIHLVVENNEEVFVWEDKDNVIR